jgi:hypothetical protein
MATFNFNQGAQDYTGEVLNDVLTYDIRENETYKQGLIHIHPGIQKRFTIPTMQVSGIIQDHKETPDTSKGDVKFTHRYLEPSDFMIFVQFNPRNFELYYKEFQPVNELIMRELNPSIQMKMIRAILQLKGSYIDDSIWQGAKTATAAKIMDAAGAAQTTIGGSDDAGDMKYFDGAIARMLANAAAADTTEDALGGKITTAGTGTFANGEAVQTEMYNMWQKCPSTTRRKPGLKWLVDDETWDKYDQYLSSQVFKYVDNRSENELRFKGKPIIALSSLPKDTIILGNFTSGLDSNLWMGVDYANDENVLQIEKWRPESELWFLKMLLKMDVNIVKPKEIIAHIPFSWKA